MPARVFYHDGSLDLDLPADRLVAAFEPPEDMTDLGQQVLRALESPADYPPLRQVVVPGDRVAVPIDPTLPHASLALRITSEILREVGVDSIMAIVDGRERDRPSIDCPPGVELVVHDPSERDHVAYLASTASGRRVYVNRQVADADAVVPIGRIGPADGLGLLGPWAVIDPHLTDAPPGHLSLLAPNSATKGRLDESLEVSWLLGSQLQVGIVPGESGWSTVLCGQAATLRDVGGALIGDRWTLTGLDDRADLVIAGIGGPGRPATADDLLAGLRHALRAVRRGGKVALLTRLDIATIRDALFGDHLPRGDWDKALAWADIYLSSSAEADEVEELNVTPLDRAEQAARLAALAPSVVAIGQADRTRVVVGSEAHAQ